MAGHHVVPFSVNLKTFLVLVALTITTVLTAKHLHLGSHTNNLILAMFIATVKATFVLLWFMHLKYDGKTNRIIFLSCFAFLALLIGFSAGDLFTR